MKIQIFGTSYTIKKVKEIPDFPGAQGLFDPTNKILYCFDSLDKKEEKETKYHEIIHAVFFESGVTQVLSAEVEEIICEVLAKTLSKIDHKKL